MKNKKHKLLKVGSIGLLTSVFGLAVIGYASKNNSYQPVKADTTQIEYNLDAIIEHIMETSSYEVDSLTRINGQITADNEQYRTTGYEKGTTNGNLYTTDEGLYFEIQVAQMEYYNSNTGEKVVMSETIVVNQNGTESNLWNWLYNQVNPSSEQVGTSIINAIKSGLGLIGDLASQFLLGFSTLFWNATAQSLTTFGMFALVMLGIGITFAVIKLVLNILRSNTGA